MERLKFLFGVHCHQPVGNFGFVFEKAYEKSYLPFFKILKDFPEIKIVCHFSGCLLDWLEENKPEFLKLINELIKNGQVEILGGGYYEPILPIIPEKDQIAQLKLMKKKLNEFFNVNPQGAWIAERVWEPQLAYVLSLCNYKAIFLDDFHFLSSGLEDHETIDFYETYHLDKKIFIFPIKEKYRYLIPFAPVGEVMENLKKDFEIHKNSIITMVDDGEKFGIWPGTYDWVYKEGWLYKFFKEISNSNFIETINLKEALKLKKSRGILHIPTQSYFEMGEWTLPAKRIPKYKSFYKSISKENKVFIKGGYWRNFFEKYEESFWIYKRMLIVSNFLKKKTNLNLLKAQCNCAWWHGIFGGLYLPFLRREVFKNLIIAEKEKKEGVYKFNGLYQLRGKKIQIFVTNEAGGVIKEIDLIEKNLNITDVLRRRIEGYHFEENEKNLKEHASIHELSFSIDPSFKEDLFEDPHPRAFLILHFFNKIPENLNEIEEIDVFKPWEEEAKIKLKQKNLFIFLKKGKISIEKIVNLSENELRININLNSMPSKYWGVEMPFSAACGFYKSEGDLISFEKISSFEYKKNITILDTALNYKINLFLKEPEIIKVFPINTITKCERGFEKINQGIIVFPVFSIKNAEIKISLGREGCQS